MKKQSGAAALEFALVFTLFLTFLLGIIDFSRMVLTWNSANEATRWGARTAVVCNRGAAAPLVNMQKILPQLTAANVKIEWYDATGNISGTCDATNCVGVNVRIEALDYQWISPIAGSAKLAGFNMPAFSTYLPRESMGQPTSSAISCPTS